MADSAVGIYGSSLTAGSGTLLPETSGASVILTGISTAAEGGQLIPLSSGASVRLTGGATTLQGGAILGGMPQVGATATASVGSLTPKHSGALTGRGFTSLPMLRGAPNSSLLTGRGFSQTPQLFQAAIGTGRGFGTTPVLTATPTNESFLTGRGFATSLSAVWVAGTNGRLIGRGFSSTEELNGAGVSVGRGFSTAFEGVGTAPIFARLTGRSFSTAFGGTGTAPVIAKLIGRGFLAGLGRSGRLTGRGFATSPVIVAPNTAQFSAAFVMNTATGQVSRYSNFPFANILPIGGKYYGVGADGLYLLEGDADAGTLLTGSITTKDDDFGDMHSKNVPFVYLGCDDPNICVTPIVDDIEYPAYTESFDGRKVKMALGIKGRYWRLKIDNVRKLQALETLQNTLNRRVK